MTDGRHCRSRTLSLLGVVACCRMPVLELARPKRCSFVSFVVCFLLLHAMIRELCFLAGLVPHVSYARVESVLAALYEMEKASVAHGRCKTPCLSYTMQERMLPASA